MLYQTEQRAQVQSLQHNGAMRAAADGKELAGTRHEVHICMLLCCFPAAALASLSTGWRATKLCI
jgi:hypothetical protein